MRKLVFISFMLALSVSACSLSQPDVLVITRDISAAYRFGTADANNTAADPARRNAHSANS